MGSVHIGNEKGKVEKKGLSHSLPHTLSCVSSFSHLHVGDDLLTHTYILNLACLGEYAWPLQAAPLSQKNGCISSLVGSQLPKCDMCLPM